MEPRNFEAGASLTPPALPLSASTGYPTGGDPSGAIPATKPGPYWFYQISEEMRNIILGAGLTPDDEDLTQVMTAISTLIAATPTAPVGSLLMMDGNVVPTGYLKRNGAALSRTTYADLWAYAQTVTNFISQATKDGDYETYAGYYGDGDGSTTFTIPDARGETIRAWDDGRGIDVSRVIGSHQKHAIENIIGTFESRGAGSATGTFSDQAQASVAYAGAGAGHVGKVTFDASTYVNTSTETRSRNQAYLFCLKY
tara:strand:- start:32018 stop:32782 length:765 start_codon:yes stop_codon:yes gene_type:complete